MSHIIHDPVYGAIKFEDNVYKNIVESPEMQRLSRIYQLGTSYLVYPGATHTRFSHSLGVYHLASKTIDNITDFNPKSANMSDKKKVMLAGLLHDIGHGPFSHVFDTVLELLLGAAPKIQKRNHEIISSERIKEGDIERSIEKIISSDAVDQISDFIVGKAGIRSKPYLGHLINGNLDVDRMDYLVRDAHFTGVPYGVIDHDRLVSTIGAAKNPRDPKAQFNLVVQEKGIHAVESMLVARDIMYPTVYLHHVARISQQMIARAVIASVEDNGWDNKTAEEELSKMDDRSCLNWLEDTGDKYAVSVVEKIMGRKLLKRSLSLKYEEIRKEDEPLMQKLLELRTEKEKLFQKEEEIAKEVGLKDGDIVIDIPEIPKLYESSVLILPKKGQPVNLELLSPLVKSLSESHRARWTMHVFAPDSKRKIVKDFVKKNKYEVMFS